MKVELQSLELDYRFECLNDGIGHILKLFYFSLRILLQSRSFVLFLFIHTLLKEITESIYFMKRIKISRKVSS